MTPVCGARVNDLKQEMMEEEIYIHKNPHGKMRLSTKGRIHPEGVKYIRVDVVEKQLEQMNSSKDIQNVSERLYTSKDMDNAYDKGFEDGKNRPFNDR